MAVERQLSYDEDEEIARLIEEFDNIDQEEEEIRQHNEIVHQEELYKEHRKYIKKEQREKERCYLMEIQKYIIEMFELNLRFNNAQTFDEKQVLFREQLESLEYMQRLQRDLLELVNNMPI